MSRAGKLSRLALISGKSACVRHAAMHMDGSGLPKSVPRHGRRSVRISQCRHGTATTACRLCTAACRCGRHGTTTGWRHTMNSRSGKNHRSRGNATGGAAGSGSAGQTAESSFRHVRRKRDGRETENGKCQLHRSIFQQRTELKVNATGNGVAGDPLRRITIYTAHLLSTTGFISESERGKM